MGHGWKLMGHIQRLVLGGGSLHVTFDYLLTPTITSFNLLLWYQHRHDCHLRTFTACQLINRLSETFHCQDAVVMADVIYMTIYGIRIAYFGFKINKTHNISRNPYTTLSTRHQPEPNPTHKITTRTQPTRLKPTPKMRPELHQILIKKHTVISKTHHHTIQANDCFLIITLTFRFSISKAH